MSWCMLTHDRTPARSEGVSRNETSGAESPGCVGETRIFFRIRTSCSRPPGPPHTIRYVVCCFPDRPYSFSRHEAELAKSEVLPRLSFPFLFFFDGEKSISYRECLLDQTTTPMEASLLPVPKCVRYWLQGGAASTPDGQDPPEASAAVRTVSNPLLPFAHLSWENDPRHERPPKNPFRHMASPHHQPNHTPLKKKKTVFGQSSSLFICFFVR